MIVSSSVRDRIHSSLSNNFVVDSFSLLQEHELRVKSESTFFWEVSRGPSDCKDVKHSEHSSPLCTSEENDCTQVLLSFTRWPLMGASWTCGSDAKLDLLRPCSLTALPTSSSCCTRLSSLCFYGTRTSAWAPKNQSCSPEMYSAVPGAAAPTSPLMALLIEPARSWLFLVLSTMLTQCDFCTVHSSTVLTQSDSCPVRSSSVLTQCEFCPVLVLSFGGVEWIHVW